MNKDVIYIDVDDDVTAIIGKIKSSKEKIVAIVPPKRAGALQSAVNLRLLDRMARNDKKQLVIISNNHALATLAASAKIPVAKNLQSKPELAEIPALVVDDGDDIIDGSELPVGDLARTVKGGASADTPKKLRSEAISDIDTSELSIDDEVVSPVAAGAVATTKRVQPAKKKSKIPDFDIFRKKLIFIVLGGAGLVTLLVWMFVFAPAAQVIITAKTSPSSVNAAVKLGGTAANDYKAGIISSVSQTEKKDVTVEFTATGQKDVGEKATGTVKISKLSQEAYGVPAGTRLTSNDGDFITQTAVTIPAATPCFPAFCAGSVTVGVIADKSGTEHNGASGSVRGPSNITGTFQGVASGGTSKMARVVTSDDIERAKGEVLGKSSDEEKAALKKKFTNGEITIDSSFTADAAEPVATPAVDQEAPDGKGQLVVSTTYSIQAVAKGALESYITSYLNAKLDDDSPQKVYSTGVDKASLTNFQKAEDGTMTATIIANGSIGPKINEDAIKEQVKGKIYGEVQQSLESVEGIQEVDVKFSYFWVRKVPNDLNKIDIEFKVDTANGK